MAVKFRKPSWPIFLFSLPFFGVGIGFLFLSIIPTLYLGISVANWERVPAEITAANLETSYGDSTTYLATASYKYQYNGATYFSDRVGFSRSSDNIGDWQYNTGRQLENIYATENFILAYVNPRSPDKAYLYPKIRWGLLGFKLIFVAVFGGVGGVLFFSSIIELPKSTSSLKKVGATVAQQAQSDHIYSSARKTFLALLGIAVVVGAISSPILFSFSDEWRSGNKAILIALIFPLASAGLFIAAAREGLRLIKFGRSPLIMSPFPAGVGGHFGATVQINTPYQPQQRFKVVLSCIRSHTSRSGGKTRTNQSTVWHNEGIAYVERASQGKTQLRFAFNIPAGQPETSEPSDKYNFWRVDIESDMPGPRFKRTFEVPVLTVQRPQPTQQYLANEHPAMSDLTDERISDINAVDRGSEIEFLVPRFSYPYERIGGIIFGGIFVGSGVGVSMAGAPFIFPLLFVPIGSIVLWVSLRNYLTTVRTRVSSEGVFYRSSFIGLSKKSKGIALQDFDQFLVKKASAWQNNSGTTRHFFTVEAKAKQGQHLSVVDRVEGRESAEALIERLQQIIQK